MKILKADNYQTWYFEESGSAIIVDPWLTKMLQPKGKFFIQREKANSSCLSDQDINKIKAIIITAPFEDHLHYESIKMFSVKTPIYTSTLVRSVLIRNNIRNPIHILDEAGSVICNLNIKALPTSYPYYKTTFSILIKNKNNKKILHEGHVLNFKHIKENKINADVAILTAENTKLFGLISLGMDYKKTIKACKLLNSKTLFITGNNPQETQGFIKKFLKTTAFNKDKLTKYVNVLENEGDFIEMD